MTGRLIALSGTCGGATAGSGSGRRRSSTGRTRMGSSSPPSAGGWRSTITKPLTLTNFPMQGTGSDILRLAVCMAHDRGLEICATIHDAILFECDAAMTDDVVAAASGCMEEEAELLLGGFRIDTDVRVVCHPDRLLDDKTTGIWSTVQGLLVELS